MDFSLKTVIWMFSKQIFAAVHTKEPQRGNFPINDFKTGKNVKIREKVIFIRQADAGLN